jgi:hypothetical protein
MKASEHLATSAVGDSEERCGRAGAAVVVSRATAVDASNCLSQIGKMNLIIKIVQFVYTLIWKIVLKYVQLATSLLQQT